jgi:hypothetical protein
MLRRMRAKVQSTVQRVRSARAGRTSARDMRRAASAAEGRQSGT